MGDEQHRQFIENLPKESRLLLAAYRLIYRDGGWQAMVGDLQAQLEGRPYILQLSKRQKKLEERIQEDLRRIAQLQEYESEHGVTLADYLSEESHA